MMMDGIRRLLRGAWAWLREVSGDSAYEAYARRTEPASRLGRREFYLDRLCRKYTGPGRCC